jgi:hypothetical protein
VGRIKQRRQGLSGGQLVLAVAETMLTGREFMVDLDHVRDDVAGAALRAVPQPPASTTFVGLAQRFDDVTIADLEAAVGHPRCRRHRRGALPGRNADREP